MASVRRRLAFALAVGSFALCAPLPAQFRDDFKGPSIQGWGFATGDGTASMDFRQGDGYGSILVDATRDRRGIWWAYVERDVTRFLDLKKLASPGHELRVEARIRVSHAPRRVNLHVNTPNTDSESNLSEFDIPDTENWHTISYTAHEFKAGPGDTVNVQMSLMDWGLSKYRVDIDYFRADVVERANPGPDLGVAVPYRPPVADPKAFRERVTVFQDSTVDLQFPEINFNTWFAGSKGEKIPALTVSGTEFAILRWDLGKYAGKRAAGSGLLELTTLALERNGTAMKDFGGVRVGEILGGDPDWDQQLVTLDSLLEGRPLDQVINTQMIIDVDVAEAPGGKTLCTISRPVLQRLLDGKTKGIILRPLGAIHASFYPIEYGGGELAARLYFNVE